MWVSVGGALATPVRFPTLCSAPSRSGMFQTGSRLQITRGPAWLPGRRDGPARSPPVGCTARLPAVSWWVPAGRTPRRLAVPQVGGGAWLGLATWGSGAEGGPGGPWGGAALGRQVPDREGAGGGRRALPRSRPRPLAMALTGRRRSHGGLIAGRGTAGRDCPCSQHRLGRLNPDPHAQ